MRDNKLVFLAALCCFLITTTLHGQQKQITEAEFDEASKASMKKLWKLTRREKTQREEFDSEGNLMKTEIRIEEFVQPDSYRSVIETRTGKKTILSDEKVTTVEFIKIGKDTYSRKDKGDWKRGGIGFGGGGGFSNIEVQQYKVEKAKYNNQSVKIFEQVVTYTNFIKQKVFFKTRKWINKDNLLLKEES